MSEVRHEQRCGRSRGKKRQRPDHADKIATKFMCERTAREANERAKG